MSDNLVSGYLWTASEGNSITTRLNSVASHCLPSSTLGQHETAKMLSWLSRPNKLCDAELAREWAQSTVKLFATTSLYNYAMQSL